MVKSLNEAECARLVKGKRHVCGKASPEEEHSRLLFVDLKLGCALLRVREILGTRSLAPSIFSASQLESLYDISHHQNDMASLNLDHLDHALSTYLGNSPYPTELPPSPPHSEVPSTSRNNFLYLVEENGARYEAARTLINDDDYWMKEEVHFQLLNNLILDYHCRQDNVVSLADVECPPMDVLRTLWISMQAQEAALEGLSSNSSLLLFGPIS